MADRPILFSAAMVRALLAGTKTQTRRILRTVPEQPAIDNVVHPNPRHAAPYLDAYCGGKRTVSNPRGMTQYWCWWTRDDRPCGQFKIPFGVPGDTLWVRETLKWNDADEVWQYGADAANVPELPLLCRPTPTRWPKGVCVSMWMPRGASRIALDITDVRVERLQEISEADAQAEGSARLVMDDEGKFYESERGTYRTGYAGLWDHINGAGSWDANPWIVALSFEIRTVNAAETGSAALEPVA